MPSSPVDLINRAKEKIEEEMEEEIKEIEERVAEGHEGEIRTPLYVDKGRQLHPFQ